ncbi:MAG: HlyD family secretion protein [Chitinophagaceae bacterium]
MPIEVSHNGKLIASPKFNNLHSEAVSEIISNQPGFLIRYGISIFFLVLILIATACWFIQYPDIVAAKAKLTSINAPKAVVCKIDGKLIKLNVKEGDVVKSNNILGFMESTADAKQVLRLSSYLDTISLMIDKNETENLSKTSLAAFENLGELQQSYQTFTQAFINFKNYLSNGFYEKKKEMLASDMNYLKGLYENIIQQKTIQQQDLALAQKTFDANDTLKKQKVISDLEYRNEKSKLLNKQLTLPQINASLISNEDQQNEKQKEILELENTIGQQKAIFQQAVNTFKSEIDDWKKKYLLIAPIDGKIFFANFLQENQQLQANQIICYIKSGNSSYYAEMFIPQSNFGKVKSGEKVLLKFPAYPDAEFGSVEGKIDFISNIPSDSGYLAKLSLPNGLTTNYNKQIFFRDGLVANAEIITQNMRLLQRLFYNMYQQVKR